jgi:hypothetical protein
MNKHLRIPFDPLVELLISHWRFVDVDLVRDNEARLCFPCYDHISQIPVVGFDITLAGSNGEALVD